MISILSSLGTVIEHAQESQLVLSGNTGSPSTCGQGCRGAGSSSGEGCFIMARLPEANWSASELPSSGGMQADTCGHRAGKLQRP